ncbi:MAG: DUF1178 family protein [Desulfobacteraceae bacterium]|nr:DUF1178 family protein [Desulfobacteraceae bacterium]
MIAYDLKCTNGHSFEGWFEDEDTYNQQLGQGLISCPVCDDIRVCRIPSTFAIKGSCTELARDDKPDPQVMAKAIVNFIHKNFDNVGTDFAKEALKIHYGVSEPRNIRGISTPNEEAVLKKEGIDFLKLALSETQDTTPSSDTEN